MCLAFQAKVVKVKGRRLTVQRGSRTLEVQGIVGAKKGDVVLVQQGLAVEKLAKGEA